MIEKISVIIPVYNAEKYLDRCLESVINQTHKNLEIILIDDASSDGSAKICKEFAEKDKRVVFIRNKKNLGQASARNVGLERATGDYIGFVDNDDWLENNFFEVLLENMKKYKVLISGCATALVFDNSNVIYRRTDMASGLLDGETLIKEILNSNPNRWGAVWNKIFDKSLKKELFFLPGHELEDYFVIIRLFKEYNDSIFFDNRALYYYNHRDNSQSRRGFHKNIFTEKDTCRLIREYLSSDGELFKRSLDRFEFDIRYKIIVVMYKNSRDVHKGELDAELSELSERSKNFDIGFSYKYIRKRLVLLFVRLTKGVKKYK